jgi:hypothetical protein
MFESSSATSIRHSVSICGTFTASTSTKVYMALVPWTDIEIEVAFGKIECTIKLRSLYELTSMIFWQR